MSLKVAVNVVVQQMDGSEVCQVMRIDTAINPNPADPTAEATLADQLVKRLGNDALEEVSERLTEYNQRLARLLNGA